MSAQDGTPEALVAAEAEYDQALQNLHRHEVAATICQRRGLHYASIGDDRIGPHLVAYEGCIVGEAHTTSPGVLGGWYARPEGATEEHGPYVSARAAAAALIPGA